MKRALLIRAALAVLLGLASSSILGQSGEGVLRVQIQDGPAMVCITSLADGQYRVPPDGRTVPPFSRVADFYKSTGWKPGDIGPVRLTRGDQKNNNIRSFVYGEQSVYPFWQEPAAYFVSKPFSITLPAGKWRLAVARGIEYLPLFEDFEITPGETKSRQVSLKRWVDMPKQGWYSGDDHVHHPRLKPEDDELLMTWTRAEDLHVANILRMGDAKATYFEQNHYGKASRNQQGDYLLVTGQEDPRSEQGHTIALNITAPVRDTSRYHTYDYMFDGARAQGGLAGYAHMAWVPEWNHTVPREQQQTWDPNIHVVRGKVDFFEILQFRKLGLEDWYDFLNLGVRLTASAGSDLPWGNTIGEVRVYAHTGRALSADNWFRAFGQGRTFVTNGPMLSLTANGRTAGEDVAVSKNGAVRIRVRGWAPEVIGSPRKLELISHGRVIQTASSSDPKKAELSIDYTLRPEQSQWIAARVSSHNGALAHSSPVYILVNGDRNFADRGEVPKIVKQRLANLDWIESKPMTETLKPAIADARTRYRAFADAAR